jgi:hypothetical protein
VVGALDRRLAAARVARLLNDAAACVRDDPPAPVAFTSRCPAPDDQAEPAPQKTPEVWAALWIGACGWEKSKRMGLIDAWPRSLRESCSIRQSSVRGRRLGQPSGALYAETDRSESDARFFTENIRNPSTRRTFYS